MTQVDAEFISTGKIIVEMAKRLGLNKPGCSAKELRDITRAFLKVAENTCRESAYFADELLAEIKNLKNIERIADTRRSIISISGKLDGVLYRLEHPRKVD